MDRFLRWTACAVLAAGGVVSPPTVAQPVAEKPELSVGDQWVFHEVGTEWGVTVDRRWRRRVAELLPGGKVRIEPRAGEINVFDDSWNPRHPDRPDFWPLDFQFPLRVGAEWTFSSPPDKYWQHGHHKVVAYESITVPAGTFDCFRIEGVSSFNGGTDMNGLYRPEFKFNESWDMTRWYCPSVKYVAKLHVVRTQSGVSVGARGSILDSELLSFALAGDADETSRYDGDWRVVLACDAFEERKPFSDETRLSVRGGEFVLAYGTPGRPGYSRVSGRASENGTLMLDGKVIAGAEKYRGQEFDAHFEGRLDDGVFRLSGYYGGRKCTLQMRRAGG